ncbi:MAG: ParB family transcriptional regulator, chromosome partitioning protein [Mycobacterium sp.]|nr:ParB family transcriptional regulator, chromosome partitioning protein [Mycobacterium sp.]
MSETTVRPARRPAKPGGRRTANRFANLAGGDATPESDLSPAVDDDPDAGDGLIAGMSAVAVDEAHHVVEVAVSEIAPHPFNHSSRSQPQPGDPKWDELLNGVRANGVRLPVLVVPRDAFTAARPGAAGEISPEARYVLIYGHRRRAAALEAGRDTMPAVIDDAIMADDGDLDAMAAENLGRQDLSDLAEADLFARYSEIGLTQRAIADRLGVDQATVSRRLALLLLAPEVRQAVDDGELPSAEAAALSGKLPYGPLRRWQKSKDADQDTDRRRAEQIEAQRLVLQHNWSASRAAERIVVERDARAEAAALGIALTEDPRAELGDHYTDHRISRNDRNSEVDVVGAINPSTGHLDLYTRAIAAIPPSVDPPRHDADDARADSSRGSSTGAPSPATDDGEAASADAGDDEAAALAEQKRAEVAAAVAAQGHRRQACSALVALQPTNAELLKVLVQQYLSGVAARSGTSAVTALLRDWDASAEGAGEKARNAKAWHRAIAAAELHTAELKDNAWDDNAVAHLDLLIDRVGYQPTAWERDRLDTARA